MNRIKEILEAKGIKQTWLAEQLGKDRSTVSKWYSNKKLSLLEMLANIAKVFDVDTGELIVITK